VFDHDARLNEKCTHAGSCLRQKGFTTLGIGLVLLVMLSLMTVYLTQSGIQDIRTAADKFRYAEALNQADSRIESFLGWLSVNHASLAPASWQLCNHSSINSSLPAAVTAESWNTALGANWRCQCRNPTSGAAVACSPDTVYLAAPVSGGAVTMYYILAGGRSADQTSNVIVKQGVYVSGGLFPNSPGGPIPLMGAGNIPLNGTYNLVGNPNGGGEGVNVAVWSKSNLSTPSGNSKTCQHEEYYRAGGSCSAGAISGGNSLFPPSGRKGIDIVDQDTTNFPNDLFNYMFGVNQDNYNEIKSRAQVVPNCNGLNASSSGIIWVTGECSLGGGNTVIGSRANPVVLVVENANFKMTGGTFWGFVMAFGTPPAMNAGSVQLNGNGQFNGAILSNHPTSMGLNINGTYDLIFDTQMFKNAVGKGGSGGTPLGAFLSKLPGSWADYL